ncbi:TPA: hypothetical protein QFF48_001620 [Enterococcus faecium]
MSLLKNKLLESFEIEDTKMEIIDLLYEVSNSSKEEISNDLSKLISLIEDIPEKINEQYKLVVKTSEVETTSWILMLKDKNENDSMIQYSNQSLSMNEVFRCEIENFIVGNAKQISDILSQLNFKQWVKDCEKNPSKKIINLVPKPQFSNEMLAQIARRDKIMKNLQPKLPFDAWNEMSDKIKPHIPNIDWFSEVKPHFPNTDWLSKMKPHFPDTDWAPKINVASEILQQFKRQLSDINRIIGKSLTSILSTINFKELQANLKERDKRKLAVFMEHDWYIPIVILDDIPAVDTLESVVEADEVMSEILEYFQDHNGLSLFDYVPKSLKTYYEIKKIEILLNNNMNKMIVMYCLERIENLLLTMQRKENPEINPNKIAVGKNSYQNYLLSIEKENNYLKELVEKITINPQIHLFERFKDGQEYYEQNGKHSLNRNMFLHGWVEDDEVEEVLAKKAILAYAFFQTLYYLKFKDEKYTRHVGISKRKKTKFRKY